MGASASDVQDMIGSYGNDQGDPQVDEYGDPVGALDQAAMSQSAAEPPSSGALAAAQQILTNAPKKQQEMEKEAQGIRQQEQLRADAAREVLRAARERISNLQYNPQAAHYAAAAALAAPTRTGTTSEGLSNLFGSLAQSAQQREAFNQQQRALGTQYDQALAGYGTGEHAVDPEMIKSQLQLLQLKQRLAQQEESRALQVAGRSGAGSAGQPPIVKLLAAEGITDPKDPRYIAAVKAAVAKSLRVPVDPNAPVNLTDDDKNVANKVGHYQLDPTRALGRASGEKRQAILSYIWSNVNPDYSDTKYNVVRQTLTQFGSSKDTDPGGRLVRFNTAISHLATLRQLAAALDNGNVTLANRINNEFGKAIGRAAPTNLQGAVDIVMPELQAAIVAGGGGEAERQGLKDLPTIARSPKQFTGLIDKTWIPLMAGKLDALRQSFYGNTENDQALKGWFERKLSPSTREVMRSHGYEVYDPQEERVPQAAEVSGAPQSAAPTSKVPVEQRVRSYLEQAQGAQ
jgi:hypothetical protein